VFVALMLLAFLILSNMTIHKFITETLITQIWPASCEKGPLHITRSVDPDQPRH